MKTSSLLKRFVTDGACMASSSCVNPSITWMALTARACGYAAAELKRGTLSKGGRRWRSRDGSS
jgi:hypothetical protein